MANNNNSVCVVVAFAILLVLATSTTVTAVETECRQQIEREQVNACQRYLTESSRIPDEEDNTTWREEFPRCCDQLDKVEEKCRCELVKMAVEKQQQQQGGGGQELERREMLKTAMALPALCRIRMGPQRCEIQSNVAAAAAAWF